MTPSDQVRFIMERDFRKRMNQLGGTLYLYSMLGVSPYEDLVIEVHNETIGTDSASGAEVVQWWVVSDHLGERMRDNGFLVMETVDGWFYGRSSAAGLEHDVQQLIEKERQAACSCSYPDRYADGPHEDPLNGSEC